MQKIIIIGCPGSGKSTFARALQSITRIPMYHLDLLYWNSDKTTVPKSVFIQKLHDIINQDEWIIDGNYGSTIEMRLQACDTVFFLDYPVEICLEGIASRKGKERPDMPWTERSGEDEDSEFISFIKNYNSESRPKVIALFEKNPDKNIVVFHSREEADRYLDDLSHRLRGHGRSLDVESVGVFK